jgi:hypothetical protein
VRAAVDAAASGDIILIAPGVHPGGVFVTGKAVTLASWYLTTGDTSYISQTVIDSVVGAPCNGGSSCAGNAVLEFASDASGSAVIGLTIQNGEDGVRSRAVMDLAYCRVLSNADGIDYQNGAGGTIRNNLVAWNSDDGIDLNGAIHGVVRDNIVRDNHQDGVEFRLYAYSGPVVQVDFLRNQFLDNGGDGIQLIDYPDASSRVIRMERNLFRGSLDAAVGCMPDGQTSETFVGAPMAERLYLIHNTFQGDRYGFVGGANVIAVNNLFTGIPASALRRVGGGSITSYALFWNNGIHHEDSNLDLPRILYADPRLAADGTLTAGSAAIDAGTAFFQWNGETVLDLPASAYQGAAPDLGAFESGSGGTGGNSAPVVNAGADQTITLPAAAILDGTVTDDGQPSPPGAVTTSWSATSGPGPVTFLDAGAVDTQASFTTAGVYVLTLAASDGALSGADQIQVTVQSGPPTGSGTVERRVATGADDAEEGATGATDLSSSDLELVYDGSNQTVGMRFTNVTLAPGAVITSAWIQFETDEAKSEATSLAIRGQAADDAAAFTSGAGNLSTRPRTAASVSWSPSAWSLIGEAGPNQRTPELRTLIQEIVSRPGWASGNALAIIVTGTGRRTARAYEGDATGAALLHIEYGDGEPPPPPPPPTNTAPVVNAGSDRTITLPAGVALDGTVSDDGLPNPPAAVTTAWSTVSGPGTVTFADAGAVDTQAGFSVAGTYVLQLAASDGALGASDQVQITVLAAPPPGAGAVERRIATGSDDAEESAAAKMATNNSDIELVYDRSNQRVGLRFTALAIPQGATVTSAWIQFTADETQSEATSLLVQAQAADNPTTFTSTAGNVSTRPRTAASAGWAPAPWTLVGEAGANQRTPELAAVVQEIVSRPGWASGNAMVFIITGTGRRTAESFEGRAVAAALLRVEYVVGGAAPVSGAARAPVSGSDPAPAETPAIEGTEAEGSGDEAPAADPAQRVLALHRVSPNPSRGRVSVELSLASGEAATLEMVDVAGRRVAARDVGSLGAGRHRVELGGRHPAGVYLVRLAQGGRARVLKAVVVN